MDNSVKHLDQKTRKEIAESIISTLKKEISETNDKKLKNIINKKIDSVYELYGLL